MLRCLHQCRPLLTIGETHDPFHAQQVAAAGPREFTKRAREFKTGDLVTESDGEGVNAVAMDRGGFAPQR